MKDALKNTIAIFKKRPLMCAVLAYIGGVAVAGALAGFPVAIYCALGAAAVVAIALCFLKLRKRMVLCCLAAFVIGAANFSVMVADIVDIDVSGVSVTAKVEQVIRADRLVVGEIYINGETMQGKALVNLYFGEGKETVFLPGQTIEMADARVYTPGRRTMPYGFDYHEYALTNGAGLVISGKDAEAIGAHSLLMGNAQLMRNAMESKIDELFGDHADIVKALTIGIKDDLSDETAVSFQRSGVAHVLSVSGLHASIIAAIILFLVKKLPVSFNAKRALSVIVLAFYCMIAGMSPSIIRSVIMAVCVLGGQLIHRDIDTLTSLSFAALIILLVNPSLVLYSAGFRLSFVAVAGIALLNKPILKLLKGEESRVLQAVSLTISAQIATLPLTIHYFHELPVIGVFANVIVVPLTSVLIAIALPEVLLAFILPAGVTQIIAAPVYLLSACTKYAADIFAAVPHMTLKLHAPGPVASTLYYAALIIRPSLDKAKQKRALRLSLIGVALILYMVKPALERPADFTMISYDIGYGDATLLRMGSSAVLVDCGTAEAGLYNSVAAQGIEIDLLVLTHGHLDHGGGLKNLVEYAKVKSILVWHGAEYEGYDDAILDALILADKKGIPVIAAGLGDVISVGGITVEVLSPVYDAGNENDNSLMLLASGDYGSVLLTGDAGAVSELYVDRRADVLKIGHHGSNTSTTAEFLDKVSPVIAVISVGRNNYGHPTEKVLSRLSERGIFTVTTMDNGTLTITFSESGITVENFYKKDVVAR